MVYVNITEFIAELKINWINTLYVFGGKKITLASSDRGPSPNCLRYVFVGNYKRSYTIRQFFFLLLQIRFVVCHF